MHARMTWKRIIIHEVNKVDTNIRKDVVKRATNKKNRK
jgi:hypothetical protein